jgi:hypothetical protein
MSPAGGRRSAVLCLLHVERRDPGGRLADQLAMGLVQRH